ncbi:MAG: putative glycoside hydrolase [FCB group bacterium]|jgi:hypothetical protein
MKKYLFILLILSYQSIFSQPSEYLPRGTKSFLVNYGAINGNPFLCRFAARRFVLLDESSDADIKQVHAIKPDMPILHYKDIVALNLGLEEFNEVDKDETAFLHSCEPSGLVYQSGIVNTLYWLPDRLSLDIAGYKIYTSNDSTENFVSNGIVYKSTNAIMNLPVGTNWIKVKTVLKDNTELNYGLSVKAIVDNSSPIVVPRIIDEARTNDTVNIMIMAESIAGVDPDSVLISVDVNRNNDYEAQEQTRMSNASGTWTAQRQIILGNNIVSYGGYEFILKAYKNGKMFQYPSLGSYMTNVNNRLKNDYYNFYIMDVGSSTWRKAYVQEVLKTFDTHGYNGLFEDDTWYVVSKWAVDVYPPFGYTDSTWSHNLFDFLDTIKQSISPRPAFFNGLYAGDAVKLLNHADGGMSEGFAYSTWGGNVTDNYWIELCNVGLQCQHQYKKIFQALGGILKNDPEGRLYAVASYLLIEDSLSMFGNAENYQEFAHYPEFDIPLGKPLQTANLDINDLKIVYAPNNATYYQRNFQNGNVVVNPNSDKYVVISNTEGQTCVGLDNMMTVDGGRLFSYSSKDTLYPKQARVYLNWNPDGNILCSPKIDTVIVKSDYNDTSGNTNIKISAMISDSSSAVFRSNPSLPLYVTAELGSIGGPNELQLTNDGSPASKNSNEYSGEFTLPPGVVTKQTDFPILVYSTTGLLYVGKGLLKLKNADSTNIIDNYSFEIDANNDGMPDMWTPYQKGFDYDTSGLNVKSGKRSIHLKNDSLSESRGVYMNVVLNQTQPQDLLISGWSKCINVSGNKNSDYSLYIDVRYQDDTPLYGQTAQFNTGTHDWEYSSKIIYPAKPIKSLGYYALFRNHTGEVWYDHLGLKIYDSTKDYVIISPGELSNNKLDIFPNPFIQNPNNSNLNIRLRYMMSLEDKYRRRIMEYLKKE